jgi:hypothetical protein
MTQALVRSVGNRAVASAGLTVLPGRDARLDPPRSARVARAEDVVRAWRLARLAEAARRELASVVRLEEAVARATRRAARGGAEAGRWRSRAHALERARTARAFDTEAFVGIALDAHRAGRALGTDERRPLVVLGDHPDLQEWLPAGLRHHPQVVHLPEA